MLAFCHFDRVQYDCLKLSAVLNEILITREFLQISNAVMLRTEHCGAHSNSSVNHLADISTIALRFRSSEYLIAVSTIDRTGHGLIASERVNVKSIVRSSQRIVRLVGNAASL